MTARPYGTPVKPKGTPWAKTDRRYSSKRWQKLRANILRRDSYRCWVEGCRVRANVCDHIDPVGSHTTDAEFYDEFRLRASCRSHNIARAYAPELDTLTRRPGFGRRPMTSRDDRAEPSDVITRDYTRNRDAR